MAPYTNTSPNYAFSKHKFNPSVFDQSKEFPFNFSFDNEGLNHLKNYLQEVCWFESQIEEYDNYVVKFNELWEKFETQHNFKGACFPIEYFLGSLNCIPKSSYQYTSERDFNYGLLLFVFGRIDNSQLNLIQKNVYGIFRELGFFVQDCNILSEAISMRYTMKPSGITINRKYFDFLWLHLAFEDTEFQLHQERLISQIKNRSKIILDLVAARNLTILGKIYSKITTFYDNYPLTNAIKDRVKKNIEKYFKDQDVEIGKVNEIETAKYLEANS